MIRLRSSGPLDRSQRDRQRAFRYRTIGLPALAIVAVAGLVYWEMKTSTLQARQFSWSARGLHFQVEQGASKSIRFPGQGPFDERLGYSRLPRLLERLSADRYAIERQARPSALMAGLMDLGVFPIYREKTQAGLTILGCDSRPLQAFAFPQHAYPDFASVPPLVWQSLLFIENRELLDERFPYRNPAVEWDRLGHAMVHRLVRVATGAARSPGGSTLATQMEKYRHSPGGRTDSIPEKFKQMASASLRAYLNGNDTLAARQQIVVDYINTIPLAAAPGVGEVFGLGDGLRAWYAADFERVNELLSSRPQVPAELAAKARAYRQVLSLLIAQRRPSGLLGQDRERLAELTDSHLRLLSQQGIVDPLLLQAALQARVTGAADLRQQPVASIAQRKAADAVRARLAGQLGVEGVYALDRLDLTVETPLRNELQAEVAHVLKSLGKPAAARAAGLMEAHLLAQGDPAGVVYSFILLERTPGANLVRAQADSTEQPFDVNEGAKLDLGSTAKLRTLITYLELVADLHARLAWLDRTALSYVPVNPRDALTRWSVDYLTQAENRSLTAMLNAAMQRRYSASPWETFYTGGGVHRFDNFRPEDNERVVTVSEAFRQSINLPFVRLMRDVVQHLMVRGQAPGPVEDRSNPQRAQYLSRFADREGQQFVRRFYAKYAGQNPDQMLRTLARGMRPAPSRLAVAFRTVAPEDEASALAAFLELRLPRGVRADAAALYDRYAPGRYALADRAYLARVHPLELWVVQYLRRHPGAGLSEVLTASADARRDSYHWLFRTRFAGAQDRRIQSEQEAEAFRTIHARWKQLGYPFEALVPSYATAIGSSADRPAALAELMGIIVNDGIRLPTVRIDALHFAAGTPFETRLVSQPAAAQRVLRPEIAAVVRRGLIDIVEHGTARRLGSALTLADGSKLALGGKTGTGDHRFETYAAGGRLVSSRVVNRTATFVFMIGDRYFGTLTAYVPGPGAKDYAFTSALPVQVLKAMKPALARNLGVACAGGPPPIEVRQAPTGGSRLDMATRSDAGASVSQ
jgi:membrane peptidoglycan carboxypeptidase